MAKWRIRLFWALALALLTGLSIRGYLGSLKEMTTVVVAAQDIPARTQITAAMLTTVRIGKEDVSHLAPDAFSTTGDVVGRYARTAITKDEVIHNRPGEIAEQDSVRPGTYQGQGALAEFLPKEDRAMTVQVDQEGVLGNHLQSGDKVDILFTSKSDSTGGVYATIVAQQVPILDIQRPSDGANNGVLVTLLVRPEQGEYITLAKRLGDVDFLLAPPEATPIQPVRPVSPLEFTGNSGSQAGAKSGATGSKP